MTERHVNTWNQPTHVLQDGKQKKPLRHWRWLSTTGVYVCVYWWWLRSPTAKDIKRILVSHQIRDWAWMFDGHEIESSSGGSGYHPCGNCCLCRAPVILSLQTRSTFGNNKRTFKRQSKNHPARLLTGTLIDTNGSTLWATSESAEASGIRAHFLALFFPVLEQILPHLAYLAFRYTPVTSTCSYFQAFSNRVSSSCQMFDSIQINKS